MTSNNKLQNPCILESVQVPNYLLTSLACSEQINMNLNIHETNLKTNKQNLELIHCYLNTELCLLLKQEMNIPNYVP